MECLLVGRPGSGRSSLLTALLRLWGCRSLPVTTWSAGGSPSRWRVRLPEEERRLHRLRPPGGFLAVELDASALKLPGRRWAFVETPGVEEGVPADESLRQGVAEALGRLLATDLLLHVVDGAETGERGEVAAADLALWRLGRARPRYVMVVMRVDCEAAGSGLTLLKRLDPGLEPLACSAWTGQGLRRLRRLLASLA